MNAGKHNGIHGERKLHGFAGLSGAGSAVERLELLPVLESYKNYVTPAVDHDQKSGLQALPLPDLDERTREDIRTRASCLLGDAGFRKAMATLKGQHEKALQRAAGGERDALGMCVRFLEVVPILASLSVIREGSRGDSFKKLWCVGTGKTWKALRECPRRLRKIANEVEQLNTSRFFNPGRVNTRDTIEAKFRKRKLLGLPQVICFYASYIESRAMRIPRVTQKLYPWPPRAHPPTVVLLSILAHVMTGRLCDRVVSEILNAADLVLNPGEPKSGLRFDPQTIADLRSRQIRKLRRA